MDRWAEVAGIYEKISWSIWYSWSLEVLCQDNPMTKSWLSVRSTSAGFMAWSSCHKAYLKVSGESLSRMWDRRMAVLRNVSKERLVFTLSPSRGLGLRCRILLCSCSQCSLPWQQGCLVRGTRGAGNRCSPTSKRSRGFKSRYKQQSVQMAGKESGQESSWCRNQKTQ